MGAGDESDGERVSDVPFVLFIPRSREEGEMYVCGGLTVAGGRQIKLTENSVSLVDDDRSVFVGETELIRVARVSVALNRAAFHPLECMLCARRSFPRLDRAGKY